MTHTAGEIGSGSPGGVCWVSLINWKAPGEASCCSLSLIRRRLRNCHSVGDDGCWGWSRGRVEPLIARLWPKTGIGTPKRGPTTKMTEIEF